MEQNAICLVPEFGPIELFIKRKYKLFYFDSFGKEPPERIAKVLELWRKAIMEALNKEAAKMDMKMEELKNTSAEDLWRRDLDMLESHLNK